MWADPVIAINYKQSNHPDHSSPWCGGTPVPGQAPDDRDSRGLQGGGTMAIREVDDNVGMDLSQHISIERRSKVGAAPARHRRDRSEKWVDSLDCRVAFNDDNVMVMAHPLQFGTDLRQSRRVDRAAGVDHAHNPGLGPVHLTGDDSYEAGEPPRRPLKGRLQGNSLTNILL